MLSFALDYVLWLLHTEATCSLRRQGMALAEISKGVSNAQLLVGIDKLSGLALADLDNSHNTSTGQGRHAPVVGRMAKWQGIGQ